MAMKVTYGRKEREILADFFFKTVIGKNVGQKGGLNKKINKVIVL